MEPQQDRMLRAGVGRREITTEATAPPVHDPLFVKALVLDDGSTRAAIVVMDAVAIGGICDIDDAFLSTLRGRLAADFGIPGEQVMVSATHTHTPGPMLCEPEQQLARTQAAVAAAVAGLTPARVGVGEGREDRFVINRTLRLRDGRHWTVRQANPCPPDDLVAELGPSDPTVGIVRIDRLDGSPLAVLFHFACHPLLGVPGWAVTANYPGFACQTIETAIGGGVTAMFVQGAAGDQVEVGYKDVHQPRDAEPLGAMLGLSTVKAWHRIGTGEGAALSVINEPLDLPRRTDSADRVAALEAEQAQLLASLRSTSLNFRAFLPLYLQHTLNPEYPADYAYRYLHADQIGSDALRKLDAENRANLDKYLRNITAMEQLARIQDRIATYRRHEAINQAASGPTIATEVQGIRLGECVMVTSPAEVLMEVALNIKRASPHRYTWVAAFANGYIHYGAPAADYDAGGYEVTECLLAPEWQAAYEAKAAAVLGRL